MTIQDAELLGAIKAQIKEVKLPSNLAKRLEQEVQKFLNKHVPPERHEDALFELFGKITTPIFNKATTPNAPQRAAPLLPFNTPPQKTDTTHKPQSDINQSGWVYMHKAKVLICQGSGAVSHEDPARDVILKCLRDPRATLSKEEQDACIQTMNQIAAKDFRHAKSILQIRLSIFPEFVQNKCLEAHNALESPALTKPGRLY